ncbi:MAG: hypothetical protein HY782_28865 [Chloroflexi bacterium]|nr:hypothetical protein [Chloroflexota bacterium]
MNIANRLIVIVELLIAIALMPILIAVLFFSRPLLVSSVEGMARGLGAGPNVLYSQAICVGLAVFVFIVAILLLFLELHRPGGRALRVEQVTEGQVEVTADAIVNRLEHEILQVAEVVRVKPHVSPASKGAVDLFLELETTPDVNVPQKTQEVITLARKVMDERMGLKVGKIHAQVDLVRKLKKSAAPPAPPAKQVDVVNR